MAMARRSELVDALAAVAVSALSGPLGAIGVSAAGELVKLLQKARGRTSEEKELQKQVREAISAWAKGERLDPDVVDRGLGWAIEYVQAAGCQNELIADADFDPTRAAEVVLTPAKARDEYWGTDPEYGVAERAVHITYSALCPKLKAEGGVVLAAIQASRNEIRGSIDQLREDLLGVADRHELIEYLEKQIRDWDYSPWTQGRKWTQERRPSQLERTLEIAYEQRTMSPAEALEGVWLLTVLGGPGSGKTWLAQRLAREAAETALEQLRDPRVDPASVELPLFTTVAEWIKQHETGFEGLVEAALRDKSQEKIRRLVLRPGARVLAVADSLDEGVSVNSARTLLNSLTNSPTWRLVVTSRPEAWNSATAGLRTKQDTRVGTLTELRYPKDVHGYVKAWFTESPPTAQHLIRQLERRRELRATATSPLLLTFYCMLTEQEPDQELPRRRRELYRTIIDLLLAGGWATAENPVDTAKCHAILQQWAWDAVKDAVTPAGLGVWPETITTDRRPPDASEAMERALDNVAPKQEYPLSHFHDRAQVERRFLHRTLWEYLVSERIATTFSAAKAAEALLPHIWFDPEWRVTLPMTVAAHRRRSKLVDLLWAYHSDSPTPAQKVVNDRLKELVLEVAAQTDPEDWKKANRTRIRALRDNFVPHQPELIASSAHWGGPSHMEAILAALSNANLGEAPYLTRALLELGPSNAERTKACQIIIAAIPNIHPQEIYRLISTLSELDPTDEDWKEARKTIITALPNTHPQEVDPLLSTLSALGPTNAERAKARQVIFTALSKTKSRDTYNLIHTLPQLDPNNAERAKARQTILTTLLKTKSWNTCGLVHTLSQLDPTDAERAKARQVIFTALSKANSRDTCGLVHTLPQLDPTDAERAKARQTILKTLPKTYPYEIPNLIHTLLKLDPNNSERTKACQTIIATLIKTKSRDTYSLLHTLSQLDPNYEERTKARKTIITALPETHPLRIPNLVRALSALAKNDTERAKTRQIIIAAFLETWEVDDLIETLSNLDPTDTERAKTRQTIIDTLPNTEPEEVDYLISELSKLEPPETERAKARQTIIKTLPNTTPWQVYRLSKMLSALNPTDAERAKARHTIITTLPRTGSGTLYDLVESLRQLCSVHDWLAALGIEST
ncbi:NACHT domain-containing protein [Arachnia propionica]|uniref:NACHT domain-containing protein n=1 Tax=Arachnia propionica TaxID=1750 RepID=UPI00242AF375|nr:NACHT domain-containing protein [Arachnia propionica]